MRRAVSMGMALVWGACGMLALGYVAWHDVAQHALSPAEPQAAEHRDSARRSLSSTSADADADAGAEERCGRLRIGWTAWADAEFVTRLAAKLLRAELGCDVQLVMTDIGLQYRGIAEGELDLMLMAWLPATHAAYFDKVAGAVVDFGALYTGARLGWAVPSYVPAEELGSIEDLKKPSVRKRLHARIQGIDPGSGLVQASEQAIRVYGLSGYRLRSGSGAAMTAALERAYRLRRWIVVTTWSPHWMFKRWQLRYLDDPRGVLSQNESIHALARRGFSRDYPPSVVDFITRLYIPLDELEDALAYAVDATPQAAVERYVREHPARIRYWLSGAL